MVDNFELIKNYIEKQMIDREDGDCYYVQLLRRQADDPLKSLGVKEIFCFRFDLIRQMTAREFMQVLKDKCGVEVLMMGYDHRFGSDKPAQITDYIQIGAELGLEVIPVNQAPEGDVSSSKIRKALMLGDLSEANAMLGYPYTITGTVVHGRGIGHQLGFPTANLLVADEKMIPRSGVYAVRWNGKKAILNIGSNPTVSGDAAGIVTLELQIQRQSFWPERSLLYWARCFNELESGKPYDSLRESCHIGILAFTLFPEEAEFYSEYRIQNCRTQRQYTDKFCICILDLTKMEMADENTQKDILQWARMIKAESREKMDAIAEGSRA